MSPDLAKALPNLTIGIILVLVGILIIKHRARVNRWVYSEQEMTFGRRVAKYSAGRQSDTMMGGVGVLVVLVGTLMAVGGSRY